MKTPIKIVRNGKIFMFTCCCARDLGGRIFGIIHVSLGKLLVCFLHVLQGDSGLVLDKLQLLILLAIVFKHFSFHVLDFLQVGQNFQFFFAENVIVSFSFQKVSVGLFLNILLIFAIRILQCLIRRMSVHAFSCKLGANKENYCFRVFLLDRILEELLLEL